jgi:hypothetical protein
VLPTGAGHFTSIAWRSRPADHRDATALPSAIVSIVYLKTPVANDNVRLCVQILLCRTFCCFFPLFSGR